jgi:hypothetical protein
MGDCASGEETMRVLGYDARVPRQALAGEWDGERRRTFLLRPDSEVPLSVDPMIWPSLMVDGSADYESSLAPRAEGARSAVRGREAEIVAVTEGDEPLPGDDWVLLGWDVANSRLVSGIANCEKDAEEWRPLRRRWVGELNDQGLFSDYGAADECRAEVNRLLGEYAPFSVYGLWVWEP